MGGALLIRPANEASRDELQPILTGTAGRCQCTRQRPGDSSWWHMPPEARGAILREAVGYDDPRATSTVGLVAWVDDEPAGWVAGGCAERRCSVQILREHIDATLFDPHGDREFRAAAVKGDAFHQFAESRRRRTGAVDPQEFARALGLELFKR